MLVASIAAFANQKAGNLIIAKFLDATSLGIFSIARQISDMASAELIAPVMVDRSGKCLPQWRDEGV